MSPDQQVDTRPEAPSDNEVLGDRSSSDLLAHGLFGDPLPERVEQDAPARSEGRPAEQPREDAAPTRQRGPDGRFLPAQTSAGAADAAPTGDGSPAPRQAAAADPAPAPAAEPPAPRAQDAPPEPDELTRYRTEAERLQGQVVDLSRDRDALKAIQQQASSLLGPKVTANGAEYDIAELKHKRTYETVSGDYLTREENRVLDAVLEEEGKAAPYLTWAIDQANGLLAKQREGDQAQMAAFYGHITQQADRLSKLDGVDPKIFDPKEGKPDFYAVGVELYEAGKRSRESELRSKDEHISRLEADLRDARTAAAAAPAHPSGGMSAADAARNDRGYDPDADSGELLLSGLFGPASRSR